MEDDIAIYRGQQFKSWLLDQDKASDEKQANEIMESLITLYEGIWRKIGNNLKCLPINRKEDPVVFTFNPFPWIKKCFMLKNKELLCDVVALYTSILRRLFEKVNLDVDILERNIQDGIPLHFSRILVGRYSWSAAVQKAYDKIENTLPLPSCKMVIKWDYAWMLYISFLNEHCNGFNLLTKNISQSSHYKNHIDPYGTDQRIRELDKEERKREDMDARKWAERVYKKHADEFLYLTLANSRNLKSLPFGFDKYQAMDWIDKGKCKVATTLFKPSECSVKKAIAKIVADYSECINSKSETLIIIHIEQNCNFQQIMEEERLKISGNNKSLKICVIRWTEGEGEGIYKIDVCYR